MHGSQCIYPVSSVAIEHEKRYKKHRSRSFADDCYDPWDDIFSECLMEEIEYYEEEYDLGPYDHRVQLVGDPDMDWWFRSDVDHSLDGLDVDYDDFDYELRRRDERFVELTAD